jgi:hypothetical protein
MVLTQYDGLFADIEASLAAEQPVESVAALPVPVDSLTMPEEFARSTVLALRAQQEILAMPLDEGDPFYRAKLMAKASLASAQINAQLKADETALKSRIAVVSYYDEIKHALEDARERLKGAA